MNKNKICVACEKPFHYCVSCSFDDAAELGCCSDDCAEKWVANLIELSDWDGLVPHVMDENKFVIPAVKQMTDRQGLMVALLENFLNERKDREKLSRT